MAGLKQVEGSLPAVKLKFITAKMMFCAVGFAFSIKNFSSGRCMFK